MIRMIFMISTLSHSISVAPLKRILSYKSKINYPEKIASSACQWHHIKPFAVLHVLEKLTIAWQFPTALNLYLCFYTTAMQDIIKVTSLTKQFGSLTAVDNLSFSVQEGDVYGFLGQNGAGKSTTIRMLLTLIAPTNGEIELFGLKLNTHRNEILRFIGAVIEKPDVYKYLSAYNNLKLFARMSGIHPTEKKLM